LLQELSYTAELPADVSSMRRAVLLLTAGRCRRELSAATVPGPLLLACSCSRQGQEPKATLLLQPLPRVHHMPRQGAKVTGPVPLLPLLPFVHGRQVR
jgi:hypothetical protein